MQLLRVDRGGDVEARLPAGQLDAPLDRIGAAAVGRGPAAAGQQPDVAAFERRHRAVPVYPGAGGVGVRLSIRTPELEDHQIGPVIELDREPVPPDLAGLEEGRAELVVHPTVAGDVDPLAVQLHPAARRHAGQRVVVRGVARRRPLPAEAVRPVARRTGSRFQVEVDAERFVARVQTVPSAVERRPPIAVPDVQRPAAGAGPAEAAAIEPFGEQMPPAGQVRQRQVRHVQVADGPPRRVLGRRVHADAKERHLIAERPSAGRFEIAGVVPPFDAVRRVAAVVLRKPPGVAGLRLDPAVRVRGRRAAGCLAVGRCRRE